MFPKDDEPRPKHDNNESSLERASGAVNTEPIDINKPVNAFRAEQIIGAGRRPVLGASTRFCAMIFRAAVGNYLSLFGHLYRAAQKHTYKNGHNSQQDIGNRCIEVCLVRRQPSSTQ